MQIRGGSNVCACGCRMQAGRSAGPAPSWLFHGARPRFAAFAAGAVAATGQAPLGWWPLTLIGFWAIFHIALAAPRPGTAARLIWLAGGGYFMVALNWLVEPFFVDLARHGWMAPFAIVLMAFGLAMFWAGFVRVALAFCAQANLAVRMVAIVLALLTADLARGYVFTGFPWAMPGHVWIDTPMVQIAAIGGAHGLNLVVFAVAGAAAAFGWRGAVAALPAIAVLWGLGGMVQRDAPKPEARPAQVRIVQPNAAQHLKWRPDMVPVFFERQIALTGAPGAPDLVVWPETAIPYMLDNAGPALRRMAAAAQGAPVVSGVQRRDDRGVYNSLVVLDGQGMPAQVYDKHHLVPFGEYMPLRHLFARIGVFGLAAGQGFGYARGPGAQLLSLGDAGSVLPLICYEAIFPQDVRSAPQRPDWILQITNDAWFGSFSGPYQHLAQARLRAVEMALPVVRAANTGVSAVINARGQVVAQLPLNTHGQITVAVPPAGAETFYARFGDIPPVLALVVAWAALLLGAARRKR